MTRIRLFKPHEQLVLIALAFINTFLPMQAIIGINHWFMFFMAKNPMHGFAKEITSVLKDMECEKKKE